LGQQFAGKLRVERVLSKQPKKAGSTTNVEEAISYETSVFINRHSYLSQKSLLFINIAVRNSYVKILCTKPRINWHYCTNTWIRLLGNECFLLLVWHPATVLSRYISTYCTSFRWNLTTQRGFVS